MSAEGWTPGKLVLMAIVGVLSVTGVSLWIIGMYRMKYGNGESVAYFLVTGAALHLLGLGVIPKLAQRYYLKKDENWYVTNSKSRPDTGS